MQVSLKAARINAEFTQKEVAKQLNLNTTTLINWEKGKTSPKANQFKRLCLLYGANIDDIFLPNDSTLSVNSIQSERSKNHEFN